MENPNPNPNPSPNPNALSATSIEDLFDYLLVEIFVRLPSHETMITCKFVSKHWLSLLSNPKFVIQLVNHKKKQKVLPWTLLSTLRLKQSNDNDKKVKFLVEKHNKVFCSPKFSLNFLPVKFKVVATFKDLVLCIDVSREDHRYYYICNPVTKRWVALPPTPSHYDRDRDRSLACLICEDPYKTKTKDDEDEFRIDNYRFRVVVVSYPTDPVGRKIPYDPFVTSKVIVFCSENSQWIDIDLRVPLNPTNTPILPLQVVLCEGMVCVCYYLYFGMFNPFDVVPPTTTTGTTTLEARVLPIPYSLSRSQNSRLLECGGRLISVCPNPKVSYRRDEEYNLLVDKTKGVSVSIICEELHLKQVVDNGNNNELSYSSWRRYDSMCIDKTEKSLSMLSGIRMISIHPRNHQLLYILTATNELLLCDRRSSSVKTLGQRELLPDQVHLQSSNQRLELQYWPTPVPTILGSDCSESKSNDY